MEVLRSTWESQVFQVTKAPYLLLDTDLCIRGVNEAYLRATGRAREELIGAFMFEAFPDDPRDTAATGVRNLSASLERVLRRGTVDDMGIQRYDIPDTCRPGTFRRKSWAPVNSPLTESEGRVAGILHHVEDVTAVDEALRGAARDEDRAAPTPLLRRAMLAVAHYERATAAVAAGQAHPDPFGELAPVWGARRAQRDAAWHAIVHAARRAPARDCADAVCEAAAARLPDTDAAAITLHGAAVADFQLAASSPWARRVEELQYITGEGPSLTAFATGEPVALTTLDEGSARWPLFTDAAAGIGAAGVFAHPLRTASATLGTLTLYRSRRTADPGTGASGATPSALAETFAEIATQVLLADMDSEVIEQIRATADQDDVNVAIGIIAATQDISIGDAERWLRRAATALRLPAADLARFFLSR